MEWEERDWSGAGVRTSTVAVHRSSRASICWKSEHLARTRILWVVDRTTTVRTRLVRLVGCAAGDDMCGLCPRDT